jgi:hypothetical protein
LLHVSIVTCLGGIAAAAFITQRDAETPRRVVATAQAETDRAQEVIKRLGEGVSYFIIPHPDDEVSAWALAQQARYPIFVLMTQGEASVHCQPLGGQGSEQCKTARVEAWDQFLDSYYAVQPAPAEGPYKLYVGLRSARMIFDFGDQRLTVAEVESAITSAREVGALLGLTEEFLISAGRQYEHPDHLAVVSGVKDYPFSDKIFVDGPLDPRRNFSLRVADYQRLSSCPGGTVNQAYAWLSPPCWHAEASDAGFTVLPEQSFYETP